MTMSNLEKCIQRALGTTLRNFEAHDSNIESNIELPHNHLQIRIWQPRQVLQDFFRLYIDGTRKIEFAFHIGEGRWPYKPESHNESAIPFMQKRFTENQFIAFLQQLTTAPINKYVSPFDAEGYIGGSIKRFISGDNKLKYLYNNLYIKDRYDKESLIESESFDYLSEHDYKVEDEVNIHFPDPNETDLSHLYHSWFDFYQLKETRETLMESLYFYKRFTDICSGYKISLSVAATLQQILNVRSHNSNSSFLNAYTFQNLMPEQAAAIAFADCDSTKWKKLPEFQLPLYNIFLKVPEELAYDNIFLEAIVKYAQKRTQDASSYILPNFPYFASLKERSIPDFLIDNTNPFSIICNMERVCLPTTKQPLFMKFQDLRRVNAIDSEFTNISAFQRCGFRAPRPVGFAVISRTPYCLFEYIPNALDLQYLKTVGVSPSIEDQLRDALEQQAQKIMYSLGRYVGKLHQRQVSDSDFGARNYLAVFNNRGKFLRIQKIDFENTQFGEQNFRDWWNRRYSPRIDDGPLASLYPEDIADCLKKYEKEFKHSFNSIK